MSSQSKKRRSINSSSNGGNSRKAKIDFSINDDVDANSVSSHEDDDYMSSDEEDSSEIEEETVDAKRIRMARDYLSRMEDSDKSSDDDDDDEDNEDLDTNEILSRKLEKKRLKRSGLWDYPVAKLVEACVSKWWAEIIEKDETEQEYNSEMEARVWRDNGTHVIKYLRGPHDLTVTAVALSSDGQYAFSGSKDHSIAMWDTERKQMIHTVRPAWSAKNKNCPKDDDDDGEKKLDRHGGQVLAMEIGGKYLAVGQRDTTVHLFNAQNTKEAELLEIFKGHTRPLTSLAFNANASSLFTGSEDRCIRHISLEQMAYVETLYGHQAAVSGIDCNNHNDARPLTVSRDRTARCWKLAEESHFIFRGGARMAPADAVAYISHNTFLTGHDDGTLAMWNTGKKKPTCKLTATHGQNEKNMPRPVVSVAVNNDLAISGSNDGYIRLWKINSEGGKLHPIGKIPIHGYINDIAISHKAQFCVVAVGQEPKLGRWDRVPRAKNRVVIVQLQNKINHTLNDDDENDIENGDDIQSNKNLEDKDGKEEEEEESDGSSENESD